MRADSRLEQGFDSPQVHSATHPPVTETTRCRAPAASWHDALTGCKGKVAFQEQR